MEWPCWLIVGETADIILGFVKCHFCHYVRVLKETLYFSFVRLILQYLCIV